MSAKLTAVVETVGQGEASRQLDAFAKSATKAENSTNNLSKAFSVAKGIILGGAGVVSAFSAMAIKSAQAQDALGEMAAQAGIAVDRFKELSFAFNAAGSSQEALADTSRKATNDLGELMSKGTGGFANALDVLKGKTDLTTESLAKMSGIDALQAVKNALDAANIPLQVQGQLLDGVARGASKLIPLLSENGKVLSELTTKYNQFNDGLKLSGAQTNAIGDIADDFDLLKTTMGNATAYLVNSVAPEIKGALKGISETVSITAQALGMFFDSFRDNQNLKTIGEINLRIQEQQKTVIQNNQVLASIADGTRKGNALSEAQIEGLKNQTVDAVNAISLLLKRKKELQGEAAKPIIESTATVVSDTDKAAAAKALQEAAQRRQDMLDDTYKGFADQEVADNAETARKEELFAYRLQVEKDYQNALIDSEIETSNAIQDVYDERAQMQAQAQQMLLGAASMMFGTLADIQSKFGSEQSTAYKVLFGLQKGFALAQAALAIASAYQIAMLAPDTVGYIGKTAAAAQMTSAVASGIGALGSVVYNPRAQGGQITKGRDYLVGEHGPELMRAGSSGRIANANDTSKMMNSQPVVNVIVNNQHPTAKVETRKDENGNIIQTIREVLAHEVSSPNSGFNKAFDSTRESPRRLT